MSYNAWSVIYGEQPSAAKWNYLGTNDAGFKDGTNIDAEAITESHLLVVNDPADGKFLEWSQSDNKMKWNDPTMPGPRNLVQNGNFINNSSLGYGYVADEWSSNSANPVQGGRPTLNKSEVIDLLNITDGDIEAFYNLNGDFNDTSTNGYNLVPSASPPTDSLDGLLAACKDFEASSKQYGSNAAANCNITGSQTWVMYVKPESLGALATIMGIRSTTVASPTHNVTVQADSTVGMTLSGLTTNDTVISDVILQTGKWYMIVGRYDSVAQKLSIFVNGIKKEVTASGTATSVANNLSVGRIGEQDQYYFDGLIQNCMIFSTALTDNQIKTLFAETLYKGTKMRRSGATCNMYQWFTQDKLSEYAGKTVTVRAKMWQDTASTGKISISTGSDVAQSSLTSVTGQWVDVSCTATLSANLQNLGVVLYIGTTNSNVWFKEVAMYESKYSLPYAPAPEDWARFPRLLRMLIPAVISGYQFEENRDYTYTPTLTRYAGTGTGLTLQDAQFSFSGFLCRQRVSFRNDNNDGAARHFIKVSPAIAFAASGGNCRGGAGVDTGSKIIGGMVGEHGGQPMPGYHTDGSNSWFCNSLAEFEID